MPPRWNQPTFASGGPEWQPPPVIRGREFVRVIWHGGSEAVWVDPAYEARQPDIHLVTAGVVARARLVTWWCRLFKHRPKQATVIVGFPASSSEATELSDSESSLSLIATDGAHLHYALEPARVTLCRRCGRMMDLPAHDGWRERLPASIEPAPLTLDQEAALPRRWGSPWNPTMDMPMMAASNYGLLAFGVVLLAMAGMEAGLPLPPWILLAAVAVMLGDAIASTVLRPVKRFLVSSGARFGRPKPFGRLPRGLAQ